MRTNENVHRRRRARWCCSLRNWCHPSLLGYISTLIQLCSVPGLRVGHNDRDNFSIVGGVDLHWLAFIMELHEGSATIH